LKAPEGAPHVLFYGHYDVQPADPLDLWNSAPFDPQVVERPDGAQFIRARGASDDKAQVRTFLEACRAWIEVAGELPCRVSLFLEGEEESGSPSMEGFLSKFTEELRADVALVCDTSMWNSFTPAITLALRGIAAGEVTIRAADIDLHSGLYGGPAQNPIMILARIIAGLKDADGRVTLPGFYDGVDETPQSLKNLWEGLGFDEKEFLGKVGLSAPAGEKGRSVLEQVWSRPTAEVNGVIGGYTGEGFKTVIPARASAKVSFRLVGGQDPTAIWESFEAYVRSSLPADCTAEFKRRSGSPGHVVPLDNPYLAAAVEALDAEWGVPTALVGSGGSIPIPRDLKRHLGIHTLLVGFALEDDAIHSPNEKYELTSFYKGARSWVRILAGLAREAGRAA
jgi:acetylornithine deacetylase/succinyl-diaminopimelate desuccinylase-like protein